MDLNDMLVFKQVVDSGSFTRAAEKMSLPKSNISRKVSRLEQFIGVRLLERSTRSLHLTEIGKVYYQHCLRIHEEMTSADNCVQAMASVASGTLRICASVSIGQQLLAPAIAEFSELYPLVKIELELTNRRVDVIDEGFDLVIRVGESPDSNLISKKLATINMQLYASKAYLAKSAAKGLALECLDDIQAHQCLYMNALDERPRWQLFGQNHSQFVEVKPVVSVNDFASLLTMVKQDLGLALLPEYFIAPNDESLQVALPEYIGRAVNLYAVYASRKGVTPKLRAFLDFINGKLS